MIGRESILWFNVQDEVIVHAPVLVYQDAINAPKANPIEKVECGFGGPLAGFVRAVREPGFDEEASARDRAASVFAGGAGPPAQKTDQIISPSQHVSRMMNSSRANPRIRRNQRRRSLGEEVLGLRRMPQTSHPKIAATAAKIHLM